jgi:dTMP kinase
MPLIVIEGLDGSGKATNAAALYKKLEELGKNVKKISFPDYDSDSSALIKMYLGGQFGSKPGDVNAYAASAFYAVDRFASFKTGWQTEYQRGDWIIADRYTTSNAVHQASKLEGGERDGYFEWLYDFEFNKMGLPKPDLVI